MLKCVKYQNYSKSGNILYIEGPSGPINNVNFRPHLIEDFRQFVLDKLDKTNLESFDVVIFQSDKFKNAQEIKSLLQQFKLKVLLVNPRSGPTTTNELISIGELYESFDHKRALV